MKRLDVSVLPKGIPFVFLSPAHNQQRPLTRDEHGRFFVLAEVLPTYFWWYSVPEEMEKILLEVRPEAILLAMPRRDGHVDNFAPRTAATDQAAGEWLAIPVAALGMPVEFMR